MLYYLSYRTVELTLGFAPRSPSYKGGILLLNYVSVGAPAEN